MEKETNVSIEYTPPTLERFGTLSELTKSGRDSHGEDTFFFHVGRRVRNHSSD